MRTKSPDPNVSPDSTEGWQLDIGEAWRVRKFQTDGEEFEV